MNTNIHKNKTMIKNPFCRPRLRVSATTTSGTKSGGFSPMSLLDRLRDAVFRLIMFSTLSKAARRSSAPPPSDSYYYPNEPHHSEAVADCIEFIKKSATAADAPLQSTAGGYAAAQVVVPLSLAHVF